MRIDWIEDIIAILDCKTLHEAAERRFLTPSAFSRRVQVIEERIGITLLDRSCKPAVPHPTLRVHEERIRELAGDTNALVRDLRRHGRQQGFPVIIATPPSLATSIAPGLIRQFTAKMQVSFRVWPVNPKKCLTMLITKQAEITLTYRTQFEEASKELYLEELVIGHERLIPVFAPSSAGEVAEMGEAGVLRLIGYPPRTSLDTLFHREILPAVNAMTAVQIVVETDHVPVAMAFALAGVGVAWVPESLAVPEIAVGRLVTYEGLPQPRLVIVASRLIGTRRRMQSEVWNLLEEIAEEAGRMPGGAGLAALAEGAGEA